MLTMGQRLLAVGTILVMNVIVFLFLGLLGIVTLAASIPFGIAVLRL